MTTTNGTIRSFFNEWHHRDIQSQMLRQASEEDLANLLILTNDIGAIILAEYDRRGPKKKTA